MKIVIICTQLEAAGAQRATIKLAEGLRSRGHETQNCFLYKKQDCFSEAKFITCILDRKIKNSFDYLLIVFRLFKFFKKTKPDAVISFMHYSNTLGLTVARLAGIKKRIASHRNISYKDMSATVMKVDKLLAEKGVYTKITAVSPSTKASFNFYNSEVFNKIKVIPNGVAFKSSSLTKQQACLKFGLPADKKIIGNIGRLTPQKNQSVLINALAMMHENIHLVILGSGELQSDILNLVKESGLEKRFHLISQLPFNDIPDFFKAIDIFVMPSLYEGLSNALIEALSAGIPVVASDIDAQRDVIYNADTNEMSGILLPTDNANMWANEINDICKNENLYRDLALKAIKRSKDFQLSNMIQGFENTLKNN